MISNSKQPYMCKHRICYLGKKCRFCHSEEECAQRLEEIRQENGFCKLFQKGECTRGDKCFGIHSRKEMQRKKMQSVSCRRKPKSRKFNNNIGKFVNEFLGRLCKDCMNDQGVKKRLRNTSMDIAFVVNLSNLILKRVKHWQLIVLLLIIKNEWSKKIQNEID